MWREAIADPRTTEADKKSMQLFVDNASANDEWAVKIFKPVAILLTSHYSVKMFLKSSVESHNKLGYWTLLAYDNPLDPKRPDYDYSLLPPVDIIKSVDSFILPHHQTWGGVLYPYFWLLKFGFDMLSNFEYVYCSNGDCIIEKPENFNQIIELLGDGDIMGCGWEPGRHGIFNTTAFIAKTTAAKAIMKHFQDYLIPFDVYDKNCEEVGNTESRFAFAITQLGLKDKTKEVIKNPFNTQFHIKGTGSWYDILGFRHIHGEYKYAYKYKTIPPEPMYYDERFINKREYELISKYWETKDQKYLEEWWK